MRGASDPNITKTVLIGAGLLVALGAGLVLVVRGLF
jgi:hypothetical protein